MKHSAYRNTWWEDQKKKKRDESTGIHWMIYPDGVTVEREYEAWCNPWLWEKHEKGTLPKQFGLYVTRVSGPDKGKGYTKIFKSRFCEFYTHKEYMLIYPENFI